MLSQGYRRCTSQLDEEESRGIWCVRLALGPHPTRARATTLAPLHPVLTHHRCPRSRLLLSTMVLGLATGTQQLRDLLARTLFGLQNPDRVQGSVEKGLEKLQSLSLITPMPADNTVRWPVEVLATPRRRV